MESKRLAKAQAWSSDCALFHAFLFENTLTKFISFMFAHLASWVITPSIVELINLSMVQTSDSHCGGYLDWRSANSVDIRKKARHSRTGTEVTLIYEVDSIMDRFVVRAYDKGMLTLSDNVKLLFNSPSKCQGLDFTGTPHSAIVL